jgi:hypothetical protein
MASWSKNDIEYIRNKESSIEDLSIIEKANIAYKDDFRVTMSQRIAVGLAAVDDRVSVELSIKVVKDPELSFKPGADVELKLNGYTIISGIFLANEKEYVADSFCIEILRNEMCLPDEVIKGVRRKMIIKETKAK